MNWKFWKRDDLALPELTSPGKDTGLDLSQHFEPNQQFQPSTPSTFPVGPQGFSSSASQPEWEAPTSKDSLAKDLEVIAAKLDTIRAQLEMLNARLANLEQQSRGEPRRPWY